MALCACIITSYNNLPYLGKAVDSVLNQTRRPDEIIIADDCSSDGSQEYIKSLARQYSGIKPIFREKNMGVAINRDMAIRSAESTYITTLDGDDAYYPNKIAAELKVINSIPQAVAFSGVDHIDSEGEVVKEMKSDIDFSSFDDKIGLSQLDYLKRILYMVYRKGSMPRDLMYSKKLFEECNGFRHDLGLYEDWDLKIRMAFLAKEWGYSGVPGISYRVHDKGLSSEDTLTHLSWQLDVLTGNRQIIAETFGPEEVYKTLMMRIVKTIGFRGFQFVR